MKCLLCQYENNQKEELRKHYIKYHNVDKALNKYSEPLFMTKYWTTEPIQTKSFNDFVLFKIREGILKRVINNKLSGSAWNFNKFNYINIKILNASNVLFK